MIPLSAGPISVVVVCYYSGHLLRDFLRTVRAHVPNVSEIILVNNSEEDLSIHRLEKVTVVESGRNLGYGGGLNLGMTYATGDILILMNPDVQIKKWSLLPESWPSGLFLFSGVDLQDPRPNKFPGFVSELIKYTVVFLWGHSAHLFGALFKVRSKVGQSRIVAEWISGGFIVTNRQTIEVLQGFDAGFFLYYEELDLCRRAAAKGIPVFITPHIEYVHPVGSSSMAMGDDRRHQEIIRSLWRYHLKHSSVRKTLFLAQALRFIWRTYAGFFWAIGWLTESDRFARASHRFLGYASTISGLLAARNTPS